jgi:hypothetical protein
LTKAGSHLHTSFGGFENAYMVWQFFVGRCPGLPSAALFHSCKSGVEFTLQRTERVNHGVNLAALRETQDI